MAKTNEDKWNELCARISEESICGTPINDQVFLRWIWQRMVNIHKENPNYDYMRKFKAIILDYKPRNKRTTW